MEENNKLFWCSETVKTNIEKLQKAQSEFTSQVINQGVELQKKQVLLFNNILQNQFEFGSSILSNAIGVMNDNNIHKEKKKKVE